ncbi:SDR family oxidoreductase [Acidovorax sp. Leaf78]|uniref:SDR family oxidoreductase n=1 Tax=unclassified Acidovorax TaxID=2684926 RepID=UPI0006F43E86|nr:SDR family oxidoreductase [Acidovorax sp. Leaf78]KQO15959.1 dTDP-4-dehydrorhamnose reductase [Acidovorax sp. Leaf78]
MAIELWAGPECTVNRVGDRFHDQFSATSFANRLDNLDDLASLGIRKMRFPLIWERTEKSPGQHDWQWSDKALARLADLKVEPIVGLLHHGSGPAWTNLLDPAFPSLLAAYADAVAARYPHVRAWTPVNEPLTTARFSALYGMWYPHRADDASFVRALLNQIHATVLAMRAIRRHQPDAQLIQTEDLGFVTSSPKLQYQADFENLRRWLTFDLLSGRVGREHPMWQYLRTAGASEEELDALHADPCAPDILGINCYLTSERHLDERLWLYPSTCVGGNALHRYADVEAIRVNGALAGGFADRLRETSQRYGGAVALSEVHLGCSREDQLRWLQQAFSAACTVQDEGHDVRAVTCWASHGTFDWNSLVTRWDGHYEPGLWDVRSEPPRITALGRLARQLSSGAGAKHPVIPSAGWWQREERLTYGPVGTLQAVAVSGRPVLITGATGTLGQAFARICTRRGIPHHLLTRAEMDIADEASVANALARWQPWAVVNAAGFVRVDAAEVQTREQWRDNVLGPQTLARLCAKHGVQLAGFSSDLVFDGAQQAPYAESAAARPLNAYGRAKHESEHRMLQALPGALVIRTAAFFGPWDAHNFITGGLNALRRDEPWVAARDQVVSPTYVPDLVHAALDLLIDAESGVWHLANAGAVSWAGLASMAANAAGLDQGLVRAVHDDALHQQAPRPRFSALTSERGSIMPTLEDALQRYLQDVEDAAEPARTTPATEGLS